MVGSRDRFSGTSAIPGDIPPDDFARARLNRNRLLAQALLVAMGTGFLATHLADEPGFGIGLVRAGTEAGLVGGIADWFAVTALFRHPLGLPIPHTAIIPKNQERIGRSLGRFLERHFLTEDILIGRLKQGSFGRVVSEWLAAPGTGRLIAGPAAAALAQVIRSFRNQDLQHLADRTLGDQLRKANIAPPLGRAMKLLTQSGETDLLFDSAIAVGIGWLGENRHRIDDLVGQHSRWWVPRTIDRRVADGIVRDMTRILQALQAPDSDARRQFREALTELVDQLIESEEHQGRINAAKNRLLEHPQLRVWIASVWQDLSTKSIAELERPDSRLRDAIARGVSITGTALSADPAMQAQIDVLLQRLARAIVAWRGEIGGFVAEVVRGWNTQTLTDRLELTVGSDLQYIRMNGTVVGACVGCAVFVLSWFAFDGRAVTLP
jgi:uncharacterized membrane-anchored protein YjiN (DUF445 family)